MLYTLLAGTKEALLLYPLVNISIFVQVLLYFPSACALTSFSTLYAVAPISYAHLAATQVGQWMKFEDASETSSSHGGLTNAGPVTVPQLPRLQENVASSMFFC